MGKQWLKITAVLLCFGLLTGCNAAIVDPEAAIRAPGATGLYQGVQQALEAAVGDHIILKYPSVNGVNTAFCPRDIDGDGLQEMLAFYQLRTGGAVTRVNLLRNVDEQWQSVQDLEPLGSDIADVDFGDLNGDGQEEVCIGWSIYTTHGNQMSIYQLENGKLVQRASELYTRHVICDIDSDGMQELGLAVLDTEKHTSSLSFYKVKENVFTMIGTLMLDSNVVSYSKIMAAGITSQNSGVYLDAYKGTDSMITELVYFKGGKLYNPFASSKDAANVSTLRYCSLNSTDINADGVVEIPFMELLPGYQQENETLTSHVICWRYFNGHISDTVLTWWYNANESYYLELDSNWQGKLTVLYSNTEKAYVFYRWEKETIGDRLFSVKTYTAEDWDNRSDTEYIQLYTNEVSVWGAAVEADNSLSITYDKLKDSFHLILA